jgi:phosphatidate cytidylyltransferase
VQFYCAIFGGFASLIGPFAGFLASGFKRAYGVKDFATTFPGHGGFLDRFDCQTLSVIFGALLVSQFIFRDEIAMDSIQ